jgi:hypothetical protein
MSCHAPEYVWDHVTQHVRHQNYGQPTGYFRAWLLIGGSKHMLSGGDLIRASRREGS